MRECRKCKIKKPLTEFGKNKKAKDGRRSECKKCYNTYYREYFSKPENMAKQVARVGKDKEKYIFNFDQIKIKLGGCSVCGYDKCIRSLQFHHVDPSTKVIDISRMRLRSYSKDKLEEELHKCILVCANCHGEIEAGITDISNISLINIKI